MLKKRMILCLLMRNDGVFCNSRNFSLQSVGELAWIRRYLDFSAIDELVLLNVDRQAKDVERFADHIRELGRLCFVPITAGGGVRTLNDFRTLLDSGADKIGVNSESVRHPDFITEAARTFGSQCVVVSIDVKKTPSGLRVFASNGASNTGIEPVSWAREMEARGAGEIFLTSIDRDGTGRGYDLDLLGVVSDAVSIPVIASGGVGEFQHLVDGFEQGNASAVSAANIFHYIGNGLVGAKQFMFDKGVAAPMWNFW